MAEIKRAAVLGSGVMGSAIAAYLAKCGLSVLLLDIVMPSLSEKERARKDEAGNDVIEVGTFEEGLPRLAECDWICEAVKEDAVIKRSLFAQVARYRAPDAVVSTNTSGIPLRELVVDMDAGMRAHFLGTHFFNPPRYMKLLELIPCVETAPEVMAEMARFGAEVLGKGIVYAKDTPNFVANRIVANCVLGVVLAEMGKDGLAIEEVDALMGVPIGRPASAIFRTFDLVGLDTLGHVMETGRRAALPEDEALSVLPEWMSRMIAQGLLGDKSGSGLYKKTAERDERGRNVVLSINPETLEYGAQKPVAFDCLAVATQAGSLEEKIRIMHAGADAGSRFVWNVFARTALYAAARIPEITDDVVNIDNGLKWGYGWKVGLFETWDFLGFRETCARMKAEGRVFPPLIQDMLASGAEGFYKRAE